MLYLVAATKFLWWEMSQAVLVLIPDWTRIARGLKWHILRTEISILKNWILELLNWKGILYMKTNAVFCSEVIRSARLPATPWSEAWIEGCRKLLFFCNVVSRVSLFPVSVHWILIFMVMLTMMRCQQFLGDPQCVLCCVAAISPGQHNLQVAAL